MEIHLGHVTAFLFVALPLIVMVIVVAGFFYKSYKLQKELKAQSDALFEKLEKR